MYLGFRLIDFEELFQFEWIFDSLLWISRYEPVVLFQLLCRTF
jgi:hypothetical protein